MSAPTSPSRSIAPLWLALSMALIAALVWPHAASAQARTNPHGEMKEECSLCHSPESWRVPSVPKEFRHEVYGFRLENAHGAVECRACHGTLKFSEASSACASCHADAHRGEFGDDCSACHSTRDFNERAEMEKRHNFTLFPLTGAHVAVECDECHKATAPGELQFLNLSGACEDCHRSDYQAAKSPDHVGAGFPEDCTLCHGTSGWSTARFDHDLTAFPLEGAHAAAVCADCHGEGGFRAIPTDCVACHQSDYDEATSPSHRDFGYPTDCAACHTKEVWSPSSFDHQLTAFPLTGAHLPLPCSECHGDGIWDGKGTACADCHQEQFDATDAPHHGAAGFSTDCTECHATGSWIGAEFDHDATAFPLTGAHPEAGCRSCHADGIYDGKPTECVACHQGDYDSSTDPGHRDQGFPSECGFCHQTTAWEPSIFDHMLTAFPLEGAHQLIPCRDCHGDGVWHERSTDCAACHQDDFAATVSPHHSAAGFSTACLSCHTTATWEGASYDHSQTTFPLVGAHLSADCADCHQDQVYDGRPTDCVSCHLVDYDLTRDPAHASSGFPTDCRACHTESAWTPSSFDHALTMFPLDGAHSSLTCRSCHGDGLWDGRPTECVSCHATDWSNSTNPHHPAAGLPQSCATCHTTSGWEGAPYDHDLTQFPLQGQHVGLECSSCHADGGYNGKATDCYSCHLADYDDTSSPDHAATGIPTDCVRCHTSAGWVPANFDHALTLFPLTGAHVALRCVDCHSDGVYEGRSTDCWSCHQTDFESSTDPGHSAANFSHACTGCHDTSTWEGAPYDHSLTSFPLTGLHVGAACASCHADGVYDGRDTGCVSCHQSDWEGTSSPDHALSGFPTECATCHETAGWTPSSFNHTLTHFPLTEAHAALQCSACHADGVWEGKPTDCWSCHAAAFNGSDDPHHVEAGFSTTCTECHSRTTWEGAVYDHGATGFPLTGSHLNATCAGCHSDRSYDGRDTRCYACHRDAFDGTTNPDHRQAGFPTDCTPCHDTGAWLPSRFDHALTLFPLTGAHVPLECRACHADGVWDGKPTDCWSCHAEQFTASDNPHHVEAGFSHSCTSCHGTSNWEASYDHDLTSFPLSGSHQGLSCSDCHADRVYNNHSTACYACHQEDYQATTAPNHQQSGFPTDCTPCHQTDEWIPSTFDHALTLFPLTGAHAALQCSACHADGVWDGKPTDCWSCHASDYNRTNDPDHAAAGFSHTCTQCHSTDTWEGAHYDHNGTAFPLTGSHVGAPCSACHEDGVYNGKSAACYSCHQDDYQGTTTPNHQQAGFPTDCRPCHDTDEWLPSSFNHTLTLFPLTGAHAALQCSACHADGVWDGKPTDCWSCHAGVFNSSDNPHHVDAGFSHTCTTCHNTSDWQGGSYNHGNTSFPLTGSHVGADCIDCHANRVYNNHSADCYSCHQDDYQGTTTPNHQQAGFPTDCRPCHDTDEWLPSSFNHTLTLFPLTGAHAALQCSACHADGVWDGKPTDCWSCHAGVFNSSDNPHHVDAGFSHTCTTCHNTSDWQGGSYNHGNTSFPLTGSHVGADCIDCHANRVYNNHSADCYSCHQDDWSGTDTPNHQSAGFPTDCSLCHGTSLWVPSTFNHTLTLFPLTGAHLLIPCSDCHGDGVWDGKPTDCWSCHADDFNGVTDPNHQSAHFPHTCLDCHNTSSWDNATFEHSQWFPIYSGAHRNRWSACSTCHQNASNYEQFNCLGCHPHSDRQETDGHHEGENGYQYESHACYNCHPDGRE